MLLSCRDDFLVLHDFLVEVNLRDSRDHFVKLQRVLPLLDIWGWLTGWIAAGHLHRWLDGLLQPYSVLCTSPRTSPYLGRSPLVCFACRWLCYSLSCCWPCSSRFFSSPPTTLLYCDLHVFRTSPRKVCSSRSMAVGRRPSELALCLGLTECFKNEEPFLRRHDVQRDSLDVCFVRFVQPAESHFAAYLGW